MLIKLVFLGVLLSGRISCKTCPDCMDYTSCPAAQDVISEDADAGSIQGFLDKFCGVRYVDGDRVPKVCCSDFTTPEVNLPPVAVSHPNLSLLPNRCGFVDVKAKDSLVANLYELPWLVLFSSDNELGKNFVCDGVIISDRYVITTAACTDVSGVYHVRVGDYNPNTPTDCSPDTSLNICESHIQDIHIEKVQQHPNYTTKPIPRNNIALVRLSEPIDFSFNNVAPICLPVHSDLMAYNLVGSTGTVAGWAHDGVYIIRNYSQLIKLKMKVQPASTCSAALSRLQGTADLMENEFCVLSQDDTDTLCNTIAGDPFMVISNHKDIQRYILYGIYSHGTKECIRNTPEVFVDIAKVIDWILSSIKP